MPTTTSTSSTRTTTASAWCTSSLRGAGLAAVCALAIALAACSDTGSGPGGGGGFPTLTPYYDTDYLTNSDYVEIVDDCRSSEHGSFIKVHISPASAADFYRNRSSRQNMEFAEGTILVKSEYSNNLCSGSPRRITVMRKGTAGVSPSTNDWEWQEFVFPDEFEQEGTNLTECLICHDGTLNTDCGVEWDYTCIDLGF